MLQTSDSGELNWHLRYRTPPEADHHWSSTHSSGPEGIATPYPAVDLTSAELSRCLTTYSMPAFAGAFTASPFIERRFQ